MGARFNADILFVCVHELLLVAELQRNLSKVMPVCVFAMLRAGSCVVHAVSC